MLKGHPLRSYLKFSGCAALLYLLIACKYIINDSYKGIWILYAGNMLFAAVIAAFILTYNGRKQEVVSSNDMMVAGHIAAVMGILITGAGSLLLLFAFTPHVFGRVSSVLYLNAAIGNICTASFVSILLPLTLIKAKRDESESVKILFNGNKVS